jgi:hypothetical protein
MDCGSIPPCMYLSLSLRVWDCVASARRSRRDLVPYGGLYRREIYLLTLRLYLHIII